MPGSSSGLTAASTIQIDRSTTNVPGVPEAQDRFGEQMAIGDINGDDTADLVVATLGEQISGSFDRGSIHVLYGPIDDAPATDGYVDSGNITGIGEFAGSSLALGHFNDDDYTDVAVGVSDQEVGDEGAAGRLAVLYGVDNLLVGTRSEAIGSATGSGASMIPFGNTTGGITTKGALWWTRTPRECRAPWPPTTTSAGPSAHWTPTATAVSNPWSEHPATRSAR